jgi:hypothetical protein
MRKFFLDRHPSSDGDFPAEIVENDDVMPWFEFMAQIPEASFRMIPCDLRDFVTRESYFLSRVPARL